MVVTTRCGLAFVVRTRIAVIAALRVDSQAGPPGAAIFDGAMVLVVARLSVRQIGEDALARCGCTNGLLTLGIENLAALDHGARIELAGLRPAGDVAVQYAVALVAVIKRQTIRVVEALALVKGPWRTHSGQACIVRGARIAVIARPVNRLVQAISAGRDAGIMSAGVEIIAIDGGRTRLARASTAHVPYGAWVAVFTACGNRSVEAAGSARAAIRGTGIVVVAVHRLAAAQSRIALVIGSAQVAVIAGPVHKCMDTLAGSQFAEILCAGVSILTAFGCSCCALTAGAGIGYGARIAVVAGG